MNDNNLQQIFISISERVQWLFLGLDDRNAECETNILIFDKLKQIMSEDISAFIKLLSDAVHIPHKDNVLLSKALDVWRRVDFLRRYVLICLVRYILPVVDIKIPLSSWEGFVSSLSISDIQSVPEIVCWPQQDICRALYAHLCGPRQVMHSRNFKRLTLDKNLFLDSVWCMDLARAAHFGDWRAQRYLGSMLKSFWGFIDPSEVPDLKIPDRMTNNLWTQLNSAQHTEYSLHKSHRGQLNDHHRKFYSIAVAELYLHIGDFDMAKEFYGDSNVWFHQAVSKWFVSNSTSRVWEDKWNSVEPCDWEAAIQEVCIAAHSHTDMVERGKLFLLACGFYCKGQLPLLIEGCSPFHEVGVLLEGNHDMFVNYFEADIMCKNVLDNILPLQKRKNVPCEWFFNESIRKFKYQQSCEALVKYYSYCLSSYRLSNNQKAELVKLMRIVVDNFMDDGYTKANLSVKFLQKEGRYKEIEAVKQETPSVLNDIKEVRDSVIRHVLEIFFHGRILQV